MKLAFVLVNTVPDQMEWVLEKIGAIIGVEEAYMLYGVYDIIAIIKAETPKKIREIVLHIRNVNHILSTLTLMEAK